MRRVFGRTLIQEFFPQVDLTHVVNTEGAYIPGHGTPTVILFGRNIAQALMEYAPPDGYPPVSAGLLDAGTVWRAICRHVFEMGEREPDLVSLLLWAVWARPPHLLFPLAHTVARNLLQNQFTIGSDLGHRPRLSHARGRGSRSAIHTDVEQYGNHVAIVPTKRMDSDHPEPPQGNNGCNGTRVHWWPELFARTLPSMGERLLFWPAVQQELRLEGRPFRVVTLSLW